MIVEILTGTAAPRVANLDRPDQIAVGAAMIKAALILQLAIFLLFVAVTAVFHLRCVRAGVFARKIRIVVVLLYVSTALMLARGVYRTVEFFEGYGGYLSTHEPFFWVFEASLMFANSAMLNVWFPARYLPRSNKVFLCKDGVTEEVGPGWVDKRPFLVTLLDPFDLVGLIKGRDKATAFWEAQGTGSSVRENGAGGARV